MITVTLKLTEEEADNLMIAVRSPDEYRCNDRWQSETRKSVEAKVVASCTLAKQEAGLDQVTQFSQEFDMYEDGYVRISKERLEELEEVEWMYNDLNK